MIDSSSHIKSYISNIYKSAWYAALKPELAKKRFIIFTRGRSGSTALVSLLNAIPDLYCDEELLYRKLPFPKSEILSHCSVHNNKVYGCKVVTRQLNTTQNIKNSVDFIREFSDLGFKIVYLYRENILAQALTYIRSRSFGQHKRKEEPHKHQKIRVDPIEVIDLLNLILSYKEFEQASVENVNCLTISYEENILDEENHQSTVDSVCEFIGVKSERVVSKYQKMSPRSIKDSVENYEVLKDSLLDTPFSIYLD